MKINRKQIKLIQKQLKSGDPVSFARTFENISNVAIYKGEDHLRKQVKNRLFRGDNE